MALTPLDIENMRFRGALAGYNKMEVEHFVQRVAAALEEKLEEIQRLQLQVSALEQEVKRNREVEDLLKNSVILAQKTCDELISSAHKKAELIQQQAQAEGQQIKWRFAELKSDQEQFEYAFHGLLSGFMHRLEQGNPALVKPEVTAALPTQPAAGQENLQPDVPAAPLLAGELQPAEVEAPPEIFTAEKPPSPKLPFGQKPAMPRVVLTAAPGQGVDRDADISDFEHAVSDAKADEQPGWVLEADPGDNQYPESGPGGQETPVDDINGEIGE